MVVDLKDFKENAEDILAEAAQYDEPVILKTGLGNFFVVPEQDFQSVFSPDEGNLLEEALFNIR